ncbi:MAG: hypothetical protein JWO90_993, partial [Solirubrobacterales bacterium]|nr:hypothetical protein [Solirubrobacterales bacterium]
MMGGMENDPRVTLPGGWLPPGQAAPPP